jgi:hypothetical protein
MPGARIAPAASHAKQKEHMSVITTVTPVSPGIPRAMVLTAYSALSPATGLSCHRRLRDHRLGRLDISVGISGPRALTVRVRHRSSDDTGRVHRIPPHVS